MRKSWCHWSVILLCRPRQQAAKPGQQTRVGRIRIIMIVSENISPNWSDVVMIGRDNDSVRQTLIRLCDESNCVSVFCLNPIARNAMPCVNVCVWLAYDHHQVPYEYESIYIYILYQDCTDNSNDHERHLKRQGLSIPIAANSTLKLWLGCYSVGETSPSHSVVGDDSPRQTAHVNWWGAWLIFWELIS